MKRNVLHAKRAGWLALALAPVLILSACGPGAVPDPAATAQHEEIERLQSENQALPQARTENEEVQRLKKENQDLAKLRSQYQEASRLRQENEQLRRQVAKITPAGGAAPAQGGLPPTPGGAMAPGQGGAQAGELTTEVAQEPGALNEGDEILVEPKYLKALMPDFDWEKMERKEPLAIRSLLEKDGEILTNVAQLQEYGITNFVVRRAIPDTNAPPQP
ncbi:MAG: hypothetical protein AB9869_37985 [Verrucomicrobiia bacterium]